MFRFALGEDKSLKQMIEDEKKPDTATRDTNRLIIFACYTLFYYALLSSEKISLHLFIPGTHFDFEPGWLMPAATGALISLASNILLAKPF